MLGQERATKVEDNKLDFYIIKVFFDNFRWDIIGGENDGLCNVFSLCDHLCEINHSIGVTMEAAQGPQWSANPTDRIHWPLGLFLKLSCCRVRWVNLYPICDPRWGLPLHMSWWIKIVNDWALGRLSSSGHIGDECIWAFVVILNVVSWRSGDLSINSAQNQRPCLCTR